MLEAIDAASFTIHAGEAVGLVGESGCGKSTLARIAARLIEPSAGRVLLDGADLTAQPLAAFTASPARRAVQMAFQDAGSSLNPRFSVFDAIADPVRVMIGQDREEVARRVRQAAARVELGSTLFDRLPHQLSGGEAARVGLARALAVAPRLLILDEPTASLDLAIQAQILALLAKLRREEGLALLFVSHDLSVVRQICDRILVMHLGQIVESGPAEALFRDPKHPYSQALIAAVPCLGFPPPPPMLTGEPQSPVDPDPNACRLYGRCVRQEERCRTQAPTLREVEAGRWARCHFV
jgi:oligopeptide/dipeptide ABC transporter ATP-binding protein